MQLILEEIGSQTGTFIDLPRRYSDRVSRSEPASPRAATKADRLVKDLRIWGADTHIDKACQEVDALVAKYGTERPLEWAKIKARYSDRKEADLSTQMTVEAATQRYRQNPSEEDVCLESVSHQVIGSLRQARASGLVLPAAD